MKKLLLMACLVTTAGASAQVSTHIVISEVYGGGGNSGATLTNDFIELYNPTSCPVSLAGWSVQYASATGNSWAVTALSGTIPAKGFYLIQEAAGNGGTTALPAPDATGTIAMAGGAGKVALSSTTTAFTTTSPSSTALVDFVGYGSTANASEGSPTGTLSATTSAERKASATSTSATLATGGSEVSAGNGWDANSNSADFVVQSTIVPQNSAAVIEGTVGTTVSVAAGVSPAEPGTNGTFIITLSAAAPAGGTTVTYALSGTAVPGTDYTDASGGTVTIPVGNTTATVTLAVTNDVTTEGPETIIINLSTVTGSYVICGNAVSLTLADDDAGTTRIHTIQGSGPSASAGSYTVEGIVTGIYPNLSPAGFYMQEEDADADSNPATSEGIFVVSTATVAVGNKVQVTGTVQENSATPSFSQAVFTGSASVSVVSAVNTLPSYTDITLPVTATGDFEKYEGMLVRFPATLTVTNNYELGRYGEVGLSSGGIVAQPTQVVDPNDNPAGGTSVSGSSNVSSVTALAAANALRTILLDDGNNTTTALPYVDATDNTLRIGSTVTNLSGIMGYAFNVYRIQPLPANLPAFSYAARPAVPSVGAAQVKVASFNVLNYFNGNGSGGGFPTSRGAHSLAEFNRQRAKIITAISQLNADIVGLTEIENDGTGSTSALQDLVNGLNTAMGANTYSFVDDGTTIQTNGTDEIRCAIIYKSSVVSPSGAVMISSNPVFNRPPVAQAFSINANDAKFSFIINHFKSKGCTGAASADQDQSDGQGCYNDRRKSQSGALLSYISGTVIPTSGSPRVITLGDYNAYEEEDPMDAFRAGGYTVLGSSGLYSYQFDGALGALDHAIVNGFLLPNVTGIAKWNINAAEPTHLDYNDAINDGGGDFVNPFAGTYTTSAYRSSDHDPVLVGLALPSPLPLRVSSFDAVKNGSAAVVSWTVAHEVSTRAFVVERSNDARIWQAVASRQPVQTGGTSTYTVVDASPAQGMNYYRLKSVAADASAAYSETRKLSFDGGGATYSVYPNPASSRISVVSSDASVTATVQIMNTLSKVLIEKRTHESKTEISLSSLPAGCYFVKIVPSSGETMTVRLIKQ